MLPRGPPDEENKGEKTLFEKSEKKKMKGKKGLYREEVVGRGSRWGDKNKRK